MLRRLVLAALLALAPLAGAEALTCSNYPFTLTNGTLADANQVMANFNAILNCVNTSLAPINNPTFTGTVTATTISVGTLTVNTSLIVPGSISLSSPLSPANGGTGLTTFGALTNQQTAITTGTTILNASKGQTINAGGNAFYVIGLNATGGYDNDFQVTINNVDSGRGKMISPNGANAFIVWPGQRTICQVSVSGWQCPRPGRWQKTGAQFFVDTASGSDTNDCLASGSGACKTIGGAVARMKNNLDALNSEPTINCATGTYVENVSTQGQLTGFNAWELTGTTAGGCNIQLAATGAGLLVSDNDEVQIANVNFSNSGAVSGAFAFATHQTGVIDVLAGVTVSGGSFADVYECDTLGQVNFTQNVTISSNHTTTFSLGPRCGMSAGGMSFVWGSSPTISGNIIQLNGAATASFSSVGFSGTLTCNQQWAVTGNSFLALGGSTVSSCTNPGSPVAGSTPFGGQVSP
jgi:hypothetical protein